MFKRKKRALQPELLCTGASVIAVADKDAPKERLAGIVIKAVIAWLMISGSTGTFLTAFSAKFDHVGLNIAAAIVCIYLAYFTNDSRHMNIGACVYFGLASAFFIIFRDDINSGFHSVLNRIRISSLSYFRAEGSVLYAERSDMVRFSVTVFAAAWIVITGFFIAGSVIRRSGFIITCLLTLPLMFLVVYLKLTPNPVYHLMYTGGLFVLAVLALTGRYRVYRKNGMLIRASGRGFSYTSAPKPMFQTILMSAFVFLILSVPMISGNRLDRYIPDNPVKKMSEDTVRIILLTGPDALFNRYQSVGGLSSGKLGGVSSVRRDGQTDLNVTFVPYSRDMVYLRAHTYDEYVPVANRWLKDKDDGSLKRETHALRQRYKDFLSGSAEGVMHIQNVGAEKADYRPYYSDTGRKRSGEASDSVISEKIFYPALKQPLRTESKGVNGRYLEVPEENKAAIEAFCKKAGLYKGMPAADAIRKLGMYFQYNYPYTLRPGATPARADFVSYFLNVSKCGYCSHFASASVLVLRYLGIPARYCEGYAIPYTLAASSPAQRTLKYQDFYDGYSGLQGRRVVTVPVSDEYAHAWTEIYIKGTGWVIGEFTPSQTSSGSGDGLISALRGLFSDDSSTGRDTRITAADIDSGEALKKILNPGHLKLFILLICIIFMIPLIPGAVSWVIRTVSYRKKFRASDNAGKLVMIFQWKASGVREKDTGFAKMMNYRDQLKYMYDNGYFRNAAYDDVVCLSGILGKAGFSPDGISDKEYDEASGMLKEIRKRPKNR